MIGRVIRNLPLPTGAFLVLAAAYVALKLIRPVIPGSVILLYMGFILVGVVIHLTLTDDRIRRFRDFFVPAAGEGRSLSLQRYGLLLVIPLVFTWGVYAANCAVCHGDNLDGLGPAAEGFRYPIRPANFRDAGTIAQLTLPYVYWRLTTGGVQNQFNSAMPRWVAPADAPNAATVHSYDLSPDEAWQGILY